MTAIRKLAFFLIFFNFLLLVEGYLHGPEQWIMKYDLDGSPISTMSRTGFITFYSLLLLIVNGGILLVAQILGRDPSLKHVNIPNKSHWVAKENIAEGHRRVGHLFAGTLIFVNVLFLCILAMTRLEVTGSQANWVFVFVLGMTVYFIYWTYRLFRVSSR